jgi:hypothetical protein
MKQETALKEQVFQASSDITYQSTSHCHSKRTSFREELATVPHQNGSSARAAPGGPNIQI